MKKALILTCLLFLAACIDVDDFGAYWEKTTVDPTLAGRWEKILLEGENDKGAQKEWTFTLKNGAYEVRTIIDGESDEDNVLYPVKTLKAGPYTYAASGPEAGMIVRYEVEKDNVVVWEVLDPQAAWEFIQKNYPEQQSIYRFDVDDSMPADVAAYRPLKIRMFDSTTYKILSSIPDTDKYWGADTAMARVEAE